jgi:hypothetical protein
MDRCYLARAEFEFCQEGNTIGTTDQYETLTIALECQLPREGFFPVLKTTTGWSINDSKELSELIDGCMAVGDAMNEETPDAN